MTNKLGYSQKELKVILRLLKTNPPITKTFTIIQKKRILGYLERYKPTIPNFWKTTDYGDFKIMDLFNGTLFQLQIKNNDEMYSMIDSKKVPIDLVKFYMSDRKNIDNKWKTKLTKSNTPQEIKLFYNLWTEGEFSKHLYAISIATIIYYNLAKFYLRNDKMDEIFGDSLKSF